MALIPLAILASIFLCFASYLRRRAKYLARIPPGARPLPGPKCYPLVGRVHDVPSEASWLKFYDWSKEYGPIYQMEIFGSVHVWISSEQVAHELLSRRAGIYSDRPVIPNLPDNRTSGDYLALQGRTDTWRRQRKLCAQLMAVSANDSLHDYPSKERDRFLFLLSQDSSQYREYIEQYTARTVSRLCWGSPHDSDVLRETTFGLLETISPSGALPNVVSWLAHLPAFLSPWQQKENARHTREAQLLKGNVARVHERLEEGTAEPSFVRTFIDSLTKPSTDGKNKGEDAESLRQKWGDESEATYVVGQMAIAGALTIGSPIQSFILAMLHFPRWLVELQSEIDKVCEGGRCPQWTDRENMPLLRAVVKEVIRWRPPVPTGIPHAIEKDDVYEGYFIPAGATIHALEWGITRDEKMYPDPDIFNPGRWIDPSYPTYKEPLTRHPNLAGFSQFGFGRRTCQGIPIVEQDLFLAMGGMAWAFDLRRSRNADGTEIPIHWNNYTPLLIAKPAPFQFDAIPRSDEKRRILRQMWETGRGEDDKTDLEDEESIDNDKEQNNPEKPPETADKAVHENDEESHVVDQDKESSAQSTADDPRNEMSDQTPTATVCLQDDEVKEAGERAKEDDIVSEEDSDATSSCAGTGSGSSDGVNEPKEEIPTITTTVATTTAVSTSSSSSAPPSSSPSPSSSSSSSIKWNTSVRTRPSIDSLPGVNLVARSSRNSFRDGKMAARASLESLRDSFQKMDKGQILELNMAA